MTLSDFEQEYTARLRVLRHWQCPTCDAWYPTGATCGACEREGRDRAMVEIYGVFGVPAELLVPLMVPDEPPAPPSTWRDRPALL